MFTLSFAHAIDTAHGVNLPGVPFLMSVALLVVGILIGWRVTWAR